MRTVAFFPLAFVASHLACSGDVTRITTVPLEKQATALSPAEHTQLCLDLATFRRTAVRRGDAQRAACDTVELSLLGPAECKPKFDACVAASPAAPDAPPEEACASPDALRIDPRCGGTVGAIVRCYEDTVPYLKERAEGAPHCISNPETPSPPGSCAHVAPCIDYLAELTGTAR